jgi:hypothetical protein
MRRGHDHFQTPFRGRQLLSDPSTLQGGGSAITQVTIYDRSDASENATGVMYRGQKLDLTH